MNWGSPLGCLLLGLQLALLSAQDSEMVLGRAGDTVELPCRDSQKDKVFSWKSQSLGTLILKSDGNRVLKGHAIKKEKRDRVDSKTSHWVQGSYPLLINKLELEDAGMYVCEVKGKQSSVELLVFQLTVSPHTRLLPGQSLTLTLQAPSSRVPSVQWKRPGSKQEPGGLALSVAQVQSQDSGTWTCTVSQGQKTLDFNVNIQVLGFQKVPDTLYVREDQQVLFSFPLNFHVEHVSGELSWQSWGAPSPQTWVTFSLKEKTVSFQQVSLDPKLEVEPTLPLSFTLPRALPHYAGTGNLSLHLSEGLLSLEVKLVVMRVTSSQHNVTCEVRGPVPQALTLSLKWRNQTKASSQQRLVVVQNPEPGTWQCVLMGQAGQLLMAEVEVSPAAMKMSPTFLAMALGGALGFLLLTGFCISCCVRYQHRRRQAQRTSQIKRLLSERKTCQCPHRLQKTCGLV